MYDDERLSCCAVPSVGAMCRNITPLRGLDPVATPEEIEAAARQYVRKVASQPSPSVMAEAAFELAVRRVTEATTDLLASLPPRRTPPRVDPPLRRLTQRSNAPLPGRDERVNARKPAR